MTDDLEPSDSQRAITLERDRQVVLTRFLTTRDAVGGTWWPKYGRHPHDGRELESTPLPSRPGGTPWDPHADAHGDACPGDCGWPAP